jgi:5-methylcytosine-specific restriction protein A
VQWNYQRSSGNEIPASAARRLEELWRQHAGHTGTPLNDWDIEPGTVVTRKDIHERFGGALYGGIQPSTQTPNVFVYSDPEASADIYPYDGWSEDGSVFLYTGEGRSGDQRLTNGNRAIAQHKTDGRTLRVFAAEGHLEGGNTRTHVYLGAFEVDLDLPYVRQPAPDSDGEERSVIVFRLRSVGHTERRASDRSQTGDVAPAAQSDLVDIESNAGSEYTISSVPQTTGTRRESDLVERFIDQHPSGRAAFKRYKVRPQGELAYLYTDVFDTVTLTLFEAKGHATRNAIREAIGQLLDYRRHINPAPRNLAVLIPSRPTDDLLDLITSLGMSCMFETTPGVFECVKPDHAE